jgi:hypothetical protein
MTKCIVIGEQPKEELKQETLEEANWKVLGTKNDTFYNGAKWQAERMYSEEDLREAYKEGMNTEYKFQQKYIQRNTFEEWFEHYKKK